MMTEVDRISDVEVIDGASREERRLRAYEEATRKYHEMTIRALREANAYRNQAVKWAVVAWLAAIVTMIAACVVIAQV